MLDTLYGAPFEEIRMWAKALWQLCIPIAFVILVGAIIFNTSGNVLKSKEAILKAAVFAGLVALSPFLFNLTKNMIADLADMIQSSNSKALADYMDLIDQQTPEAQSGEDNWFVALLKGGLGELWKHITYSFITVYTNFSTFVYAIARLAQMALAGVAYAFMPIFIALCATRNMRFTGLKYILSTIAILSWPIGWAIVDFGLKIICQYMIPLLVGGAAAGAVAGPGGVAAGAGLGLLLALILPATWIIAGTFITPFAMHGLLNGSPAGEIMTGAAAAVAAAPLGAAKVAQQIQSLAGSGMMGGAMGSAINSLGSGSGSSIGSSSSGLNPINGSSVDRGSSAGTQPTSSSAQNANSASGGSAGKQGNSGQDASGSSSEGSTSAGQSPSGQSAPLMRGYTSDEAARLSAPSWNGQFDKGDPTGDKTADRIMAQSRVSKAVIN